MEHVDPSGLSRETVEVVLSRYGLRAETPAVPAGGTASPKVVFRAGEVRYLLRRRRAEFCPEPVVRFDHSVIRRLAGAGLPVVEPLPAGDGATWVTLDGSAYEVFPFVEGLAVLDQRSLEQVADAGRKLGRLHRTTEGFRPEGRKHWPREFAMAANRGTLTGFLSSPHCRGPLRPVAERLLLAVERVVDGLPNAEVGRLPHCIIHGDYTWANVMFRGPSVGGIFDFDWTDYHPRIHDVARGLIWFAGDRHGPLDPDDIRHLVQGWTINEGRTGAFLAGYAELVELTDAERHLLPVMIAETWFCCRIRAMRKVPAGEKLQVLGDGLASSLEFLADAAWPWGPGGDGPFLGAAKPQAAWRDPSGSQ